MSDSDEFVKRWLEILKVMVEILKALIDLLERISKRAFP